MIVISNYAHPTLLNTFVGLVGVVATSLVNPDQQRDQTADKPGPDTADSTPCGTFAVSRVLAEQPESEKDFDDKARQRQQPGCHQQVS